MSREPAATAGPPAPGLRPASRPTTRPRLARTTFQGAGLLVVAALFVVVQLTAVSPRMPLGWDEGVYVSQVGTPSPAAYFSAPRARGISWLAAPAVLVGDSTVVLRAWMLLLAAIGLVVAYWPWRRLVGSRVTTLAAGLFAGLWVVQFYAAEVMPNLYVAYGVVAATGWFLRAVGRSRTTARGSLDSPGDGSGTAAGTGHGSSADGLASAAGSGRGTRGDGATGGLGSPTDGPGTAAGNGRGTHGDGVAGGRGAAGGGTDTAARHGRGTSADEAGPAARGGRGRAASGRGAATGVAVSVAFTALVRPPDAVWLAATLLLAMLVVRAWRRPVTAIATVVGTTGGLVPWVVEAYQRFGGPLARLRAGSEVQGGMDFHLAVGMQMRSANGPLLCRPCTVPWSMPLLTLWWFALPAAALAGLYLAGRSSGRFTATRRRSSTGSGGAVPKAAGAGTGPYPWWGAATPTGLGSRPGRRLLPWPTSSPGGRTTAHGPNAGPTPASDLRGAPTALGALTLASVCAVAMSVQYLFFLSYAAPRFLVPGYALLVLPVALFVLGLPRTLPVRWRPAAFWLLACCLVVHLAGQYLLVRHRAAAHERSRTALVQLAHQLNEMGLRPPCTLVGPVAVPLAYEARCSSEALSGNNTSLTFAGLSERARREPLAAAQQRPAAPAYAQGWSRCSFTLADGQRWYLFRPPAPAVRWGPCPTTPPPAR